MNSNIDIDNLEKALAHEYEQEVNKLIKKINDVKYTQLFKGYDTTQVDNLLDEIIKGLKEDESYDMVSSPIITIEAERPMLRKAFRGYNAEEVDAFLDEITQELIKMDEIKRKHIK